MLSELKSVPGARHSKKRIGRGIGSGLGKTSGKGHKGQNARSGGGVRPGFEGGQLPLFQRIPKRGFNNISRKEYAIVNISDLEKNSSIDTFDLVEFVKLGLVKKIHDGIKILGNGSLTRKITVKANKFSKSAKDAIEKAGGSAVEV